MTTIGLLVAGQAAQTSTWRVSMAGDVLGLDSTELRQRLGSIPCEQEVLAHLISAAERGILSGHAERKARTQPNQHTVH